MQDRFCRDSRTPYTVSIQEYSILYASEVAFYTVLYTVMKREWSATVTTVN